ncbi:transmembrane nine 7 [Artemisia annua]|uniref:Transmembrane nine 7 n=1 Tax=Artemisia annua TaxID=35608 RepID=A0A2U1N2S7_ARTAN|nr:transmembrane nine 7 [Artemisia annua]
MRSKVEMGMKKESAKTFREVRRGKKIQKKLVPDEEWLIYNLKRGCMEEISQEVTGVKVGDGVIVLRSARKCYLSGFMDIIDNSQKLELQKLWSSHLKMGQLTKFSGSNYRIKRRYNEFKIGLGEILVASVLSRYMNFVICAGDVYTPVHMGPSEGTTNCLLLLVDFGTDLNSSVKLQKTSLFQFHIREELPCKVSCAVKLDAQSAKYFKEKIDDDYRIHIIQKPRGNAWV